MNTNDTRVDRLYALLPAIYRMRDAERSQPLRALLQVVAEQVNGVEDDIAQLYENWFIETCQDWVVPYIGDLIGYRQVHEAGEPGDPATAAGLARNRILIPRNELANTVRFRRRKGTLALLEQLSGAVAKWPARAVEFHRLLGWAQHLDHQRLDRGRLCDLRDNDALMEIDGPFDRLAHTVDIREIGAESAAHSRGRYNIPNVGLFVWRLKPYTVTETAACCIEERGAQCYEFSALGHDTQLFTRPLREAAPTHIAEEGNLPVPIRRWAFDDDLNDLKYGRKAVSAYYGPDKSFVITVPEWSAYGDGPVPAAATIPADLHNWSYRPPRDRIAVDVVLGRMVFPPGQLPKQGVRVSYTYGFSDDLGGGEYARPLSQPDVEGLRLYAVGEQQAHQRISDALARWREEMPQHAVIEIQSSGVFVEAINIALGRDQSLQIRAASGVRPVIRLQDAYVDRPDPLRVVLAQGSRITFDGLLITGRPVNISAAEGEAHPADSCAAEVIFRHCTLVPGWGVDCDCEPKRPAEPSLELFNVKARVTIDRSIIGSIQVNEDEVRSEPIPIILRDSILDATGDEREALGAPGHPVAHAVLTVQRCTVFGEILVHAIELAENSIFTNCVSVARRQRGCMRFCYVPDGCRTPRRYHCQPDLVRQTAAETIGSGSPELLEAQDRESARVRPVFGSTRYGRQDYAQLSELCAEEILRGADDESEMGVFHDLFNPQREANLRARLEEYSPAGMQAGIIFVT